MRPGSIAPKVLEPRRRQLRIPDRVLDVLVPHPGLDCPCVVAGVSEGVAASVPEHVGVDREGEISARADALNQPINGVPCEQASPLGR
jgi:hypothetical protein